MSVHQDSRTTAAGGAVGDASAFREVLLARRASHLEQLDHLSSAAAELLDEAQVVDSSDDGELGEANTANVEHDRLLALVYSTRQSLQEVDAALARMDDGTYGICQACRQPIAEARLEAVPGATHCVGCKSGGLGLRLRSTLRQPQVIGAR